VCIICYATSEQRQTEAEKNSNGTETNRKLGLAFLFVGVECKMKEENLMEYSNVRNDTVLKKRPNKLLGSKIPQLSNRLKSKWKRPFQMDRRNEIL